MVIGFIIVCGYTLGAPQTVDGCRPYTKLFSTVSSCELASFEAKYLDFGEETTLTYSDCISIGEEL